LAIVGLFVVGFWIRDMIAAQIWWEKKRYNEWYGAGSIHENRAEYD
jgi:hypothetical protein